MKGIEIKKIVDSGKKVLVRFNKNVEIYETQFEEGMVAEIVGAFKDKVNDDELEFILDESKFLKINLPLEKPVWASKTGDFVPYSQKYKRDSRTSLYDNNKKDVQNFDIIDGNLNLMEEYLNSDTEQTYTEWLEEALAYYKEINS